MPVERRLDDPHHGERLAFVLSEAKGQLSVDTTNFGCRSSDQRATHIYMIHPRLLVSDESIA